MLYKVLNERCLIMYEGKKPDRNHAIINIIFRAVARLQDPIVSFILM